MRILLVEDELPAARQLEKMIGQARPGTTILGVIDSVERAVDWLRREAAPDLIFMDIQLADGLSFDIFSKTDIQAPVIFTTAYDQYTLRAFKVNSIDYLLKPIEPDELSAALQKYERMFRPPVAFDPQLIDQLIHSVSRPAYRERFLVKSGQALSYLSVADIRYFWAEEGLVFAMTAGRRKHHLDYTLDQLEESLDPARFFRLNRKVVTGVDAIRKISPYFNSRLILELDPPADFEVIVSRDRVAGFKVWLDR